MNKPGEFKHRVWLGSLNPGQLFTLAGYRKDFTHTIYMVEDVILTPKYDIVACSVHTSKHHDSDVIHFFDSLTYVWI